MVNKLILILLSLCIALTPSCGIFGGSNNGENGNNNNNTELFFKTLWQLLSSPDFWAKLDEAEKAFKANPNVDTATRFFDQMHKASLVLEQINAAVNRAKMDQFKQQLESGTVPPDFAPLMEEALKKLKGEKTVAEITTARRESPRMVAVAFFSNPDLKNQIELSRNNERLETEIWALHSQLTNWEQQDAELRKQSAKAALKAAETLGVDTATFNSLETPVAATDPTTGVREFSAEDVNALSRLKDALKGRITIIIHPQVGHGG